MEVWILYFATILLQAFNQWKFKGNSFFCLILIHFHCLSPKYLNYINFHIKELHRTQENEYQNEENKLSELPSSGLVNAQAFEARIAEKIITARHNCGYCLAILSGESDQSGNLCAFLKNTETVVT